MKKILIILCLIFGMMVSCQKTVIKIRPDDIYVRADGGTYQVKVKHASRIQDFGPEGKQEEKHTYKDGTIYVVTTDWLEASYYPKYDNMTVVVFENTTGEKRDFTIIFTSGNYFGNFSIWQAAN